jgi:lysyl endopeptidase
MKIYGKEKICLCGCWYFFTLVMVMLTRATFAQTSMPFARDAKHFHTLPTQFLSKDSLLANAKGNSGSWEDVAGYVFQTDFNTINSGAWLNFSDEYDTWILKISIREVAGISVIFSQMKLDRNAKLFIYNLRQRKGAFDRSNIPPSATLAIEYLAGDDLVVELDVPTGNRSSYFSVSAVSFTDNHALVNQSSSPDNTRTESCYTCLTGKFWEYPKQSVVKIITFRESEAIMCTGALINNTSQDARPYILTAQHCIVDQQDADKSFFMFGDNDVNCDGVTMQRSSLSGGILRASSYENDFSLVELYDRVPLGAHPYFAGWDISDRDIDHVSCIHHPLGAQKKISVGHDKIEISDFVEEDKPPRMDDSFWHIQQWDEGVTEGGSSGAPLFNRQQKIIGSLTGGVSTCEAPYNDYFERLSVAWNYTDDVNHQLQHWLDPLSSGKKILNGFDPFGDNDDTCDTLSNIQNDENTTLIPWPSGMGFLSGCNSVGVTSYAEAFHVDEGKITGLQIYIGSINSDAEGGVFFSIAEEENDLPGTEVATVFVPYRNLHLYFNYISFYPFVGVSRIFFVICTPDCVDDYSFAVEAVPWRRSGYNTTFVKKDNAWHPIINFNSDGMGTSLYVEPIVCAAVPDSDVGEQVKMVLYPNPVSMQVIVKLPESENEIVSVQLFGLDGNVVAIDSQVYADNIMINTSSLMSAPYMLKVITKKTVYVGRFVKL